MFCTNNINKDSNANKDIIDMNGYLDKENLAQNKNLTEQENSNIKSLNFNAREFIKNQFAEAYKKPIGLGYY